MSNRFPFCGKSANPIIGQARGEPVEYPSLSDYHDLGLDHFTSEDVFQLHEAVSVDEPTADQPVSHQPSDFVPIFKVNLAQRDFDDEFFRENLSTTKTVLSDGQDSFWTGKGMAGVLPKLL